MHQFPTGSVCVVGLSKAANRNPITHVHQSLIGSFVVNPENGVIYQVQFNTICNITNYFISEQLVGLSLFYDIEEMSNRILTRYLGDSRRAILVILRDAAAKLRELPTRQAETSD